MVQRSPLAEKLAEVNDRIASACAKARRERNEVTLVAVTKTAVPEQIREILQLGVTDIGESRVQVLIQRAAQFNEFAQRRMAFGDGIVPPKIRWHMIGHLQRNKVKQLLPLVDLIHSVDSLRLAEELETQAIKANRKVNVLLEVNASEEPSKHGVAVGATLHLAEQIASMDQLQIAGLMAMGPLNATAAQTQAVFSRVREVFEEIRWQKIGGAGFKHLSMGMSNDFELAIAEGATLVRVGSLLFGGPKADHDESED